MGAKLAIHGCHSQLLAILLLKLWKHYACETQECRDFNAVAGCPLARRLPSPQILRQPAMDKIGRLAAQE